MKIETNVNAMPNEIRLLDVEKDVEIYKNEENLQQVLSYLEEIGGDILVTDLGVYYAEQCCGVYILVEELSVDWMESNDFLEMVYEKREEQEILSIQGEFLNYFNNIPIPMQMYEYEKIYKSIPEEIAEEAWLNIYVKLDYNASSVNKDIFSQLSKKDNKEESDETITIYRGEGDASSEHTEALSWTTDLGKAIYFATRIGFGRAVWKAKTKKCDIAFDTDMRGEKEIIVSPDKVFDVEKMDMYPFENDEIINNISDCKEYSVWFGLLEMYEDKEVELVRVCRTIILVKFLAEELGLNQHDEFLTAMCAAYHEYDNDGKLCAEKMSDTERLHREDKLIVKKVLEYHNADDKIFEKAINNIKSITNKDRAMKIYHILMDAITLANFKCDHNTISLDFDALYFAESKRFTMISLIIENEELEQQMIDDDIEVF